MNYGRAKSAGLSETFRRVATGSPARVGPPLVCSLRVLVCGQFIFGVHARATVSNFRNDGCGIYCNIGNDDF